MRPSVRSGPPRPVLARALRRGRSSRVEPRFVVPLVSVRVRPVTPQRMCIFPQPPRGETGKRTGLRSRRRKACPFDSDRGDHTTQGEQHETVRRRQHALLSKSHASAARASPLKPASSVVSGSCAGRRSSSRSSAATIPVLADLAACFKRCCMGRGCFRRQQPTSLPALRSPRADHTTPPDWPRTSAKLRSH